MKVFYANYALDSDVGVVWLERGPFLKHEYAAGYLNRMKSYAELVDSNVEEREEAFGGWAPGAVIPQRFPVQE